MMPTVLNWWVSSPRMTIWVQVNLMGKIVDGAPIIKRFKNQPLINLIRWMRKQGRVEMKGLPAMEEIWG